MIKKLGVEKIIKVHSAFPFSDNDNKPKMAFKQRERYPASSFYHVFGMSNSDLSDNTEEDANTLRFFDNVVCETIYYYHYF